MPRKRPAPRPFNLTIRQLELVKLMEDELSIPQIAAQMGIEVSSVQRHRENAYQRMGAKSRDEAVAMLRAWKKEQMIDQAA
jgi:DNA-binding CsgD family transcriptional regulator